MNFDTDRSGDANAADTYWNGGAGWDPIGNFDPGDASASFRGAFEGNGHTIDNLYIKHADTGIIEGVGLFVTCPPKTGPVINS